MFASFVGESEKGQPYLSVGFRPTGSYTYSKFQCTGPVYRVDSESDASVLLRSRGIQPTTQRCLVLNALLDHGVHMAAEDLHLLVNASSPKISKATIYNTLGLLVAKGLVRAVIANPAKVFYDPNTAPHHHFYDEATGELTDVEAKDIQITGLPRLPDGSELQGVDVIIRVRPVE